MTPEKLKELQAFFDEEKPRYIDKICTLAVRRVQLRDAPPSGWAVMAEEPTPEHLFVRMDVSHWVDGQRTPVALWLHDDVIIRTIPSYPGAEGKTVAELLSKQ